MKLLTRVAATLLFAAVAFGLGFGLRDIFAGRMPSLSSFRALAAGPDGNRDNPYVVFEDNYRNILANYRRAVDPTKLKYAAMEGLVSSLGDPHTNFLEPVVAKNFNIETHGDFVGIGARLSPDPMGAKIAVVFKGSPAEKAGVKVGDMIVAVDGSAVSGLGVDRLIDRIKGEPGTTVRIRILRAGSPKPLELSVVRQKIVVPTCEGKMIGNIGYVEVSGFAEPTPGQFEEALLDIKSHNPQGLIIDLRGNPGGLLDSATQMLSRFVDGGVAVTMKGRHGALESKMIPTGGGLGFTCPVAILINEDSASAAEIFSGVMKDYHKATLIGQHTYGKASVQTTHVIPQDMALVKITIAHYYLPSGAFIGRKVDEDGEFLSGGIKPDVPAPFPTNVDQIFGDPSRDSQLQKALEYLKAKQTTHPAGVL